MRMHSNQREDIDEVFAGDIVAAVGLKNTFTGDTLSAVDKPLLLEAINFPEPVISVAIEPKSKGDSDKMGDALAKLAEEDPTFVRRFEEETGQTLISGMGELHLEVIVDRMLREFGVNANVGRPQVAYREALTQAHGAGIVHRDIKPSNVFLHGTNGDRTVKVIDFGIAKLTDAAEVPGAETTTLSGMFLGTPAYMAPERVFNQPYDGRADVYAVGVMIFEMVSGRLPFERTADGHLSLMRMHAMDKPMPLGKVVSDAHPKLEVAVTSAMRKEPAERPTAAQMSAMLRELLPELKNPGRNRRAVDHYHI